MPPRRMQEPHPGGRFSYREGPAMRTVATAALLLATACHAGERLPPQDVAVLAATCVTCHGPDGQGSGGIPALRGRGADVLLARMRALKARGPEHAGADATIMPLLLQGYGDAQIAALAEWFGGRR